MQPSEPSWHLAFRKIRQTKHLGNIIPLFTTETQLIKACQQGNAKAQQWLYDRYAPRLLTICRRYLANDMEAEDVMVDGFVKIFEKINDFRFEGSFEGWMKRLMVNEALMALRSKKKEGFMVDYELAHSELAELPNVQLEATDLLQMVAQLPTGFRTVFNMYAIEGYNHAEIANILGINEGTSKSQLSRARAMLQQKIQELDRPLSLKYKD
jgi:RNA polymerase sigma factor (sigma-70 family)